MTYRQIFENYLPQDIAELAIENAIAQNQDGYIDTQLEEEFSNITYVLGCAFLWEDTPQEFDYWDEIFTNTVGCTLENFFL